MSFRSFRAPSLDSNGRPVSWPPTPRPGQTSATPAPPSFELLTPPPPEWIPFNPGPPPSDNQWRPTEDDDDDDDHSIQLSREYDEPISSRSSMSSNRSKNSTKSTKTSEIARKRLTPGEDLKLIQLCIQHSNTYGQPKKLLVWWKIIGNKFNNWLGAEVTNHRRHVDKLIEKRQLFLSMLGTGDEDEESPFKEAIDSWIAILATHQEVVGAKKKTAEEERRENDLMKEKRDDWSKLLSQRKKRKAQQIDSDSEDDFSDDDEDDVELSTTRSQSSATPLLRRIQQLRPSSDSRSSSSRSSRESSKFTAAKRVKLEAASTNASITKLVDAVTTMVDDRKARRANAVDESLSIRLKKLEDDADEAKKDRQLQSEQLSRILDAVRTLRGDDN